jgi:hypothetical protein
MLQLYRDALKAQYFTTEKLKKHALLKSNKWTRASYELLSDLIGQELSASMSFDEQRRIGTSISSRTLQGFFDGDYRLSYPLDPRTLNTLHKLVRFVGFSDWEVFVEKIDATQKERQKKASDDVLVLDVVRQSIEAEFRTYTTLPQPDFTFLEGKYLPKSSAWLRVNETIQTHQAANRCISNQFNPSTCEVLEMDILKLSDTYAQVKTKEYWLLCWWSLEAQRYVQRFKDISEHYYILIKTTEGWRVKTNASLSELSDAIDIQEADIQLEKPVLEAVGV